ncbi:MAG: hypothetical protein ACPHUB_06310 [Candidatus Puniceispirillaceae bacterium]
MKHPHQTTPSANRAAVGTTILSAAILCVAMLGTATAETRVETVLGTVTKSDPIRSSYVRKTPKDERVCRTEDVPIYGESKSGQSDLGAMIVGGLIGSAIGNKLSDNEGAGAAGTVAGAILGREHAKNTIGQGEVVGYRQQNICETRTIMTEQTIEEITGYRNTIEIDNKIIMLESARPLAPNERVEITRQVTYSLR